MVEFYVRGLRVVVRFSFFAVLLLMLEFMKSDWGLWCAGASILHELGHLFAFSLVGATPSELSFECGGIRIVPSGKLLSPGKEALVLLGGSLVNLSAAAILFMLQAPFAGGFHLLLGIFNLLPLRALDGGQLLYLGLSRFCGLRLSEILAQGISLILLLVLGIFGWKLFTQSGNFTLLLTLLYLLFASLLPRNARS